MSRKKLPAVYYWIPVTRQQIVNEMEGTVVQDVLESVGLTSIFEGRLSVPDKTMYVGCLGPRGGEGTLLWPKPVQYLAGGCELPTCKVAHAEWHECDGYWIGYEEGTEPLSPDYFARMEPDVLIGIPRSDAVGNQWVAPVIRATEGRASSCEYEYRVGFKKGDFSTRVKSVDEHLWGLAREWYDHLMQLDLMNNEQEFDESKLMSDEHATESVISLLAKNYFVSEPEIALLSDLGSNPLSVEFAMKVGASAIDLSLVHEFEQKKTE